MKKTSKYDLVVKDLFQRDHPSLLDQLTAGVPVREVLNIELARVEERRADLVLLMADGNAQEIRFQCPSCGQDLIQTIGRLRASEHMTCSGCSIGINIDTDRLAKATEEIQKAIEKIPAEITIKFFR